MRNKVRLIAGLLANALIVILEVLGLFLSFRDHQWSLLQFYTQDSNIIAMLACAAMAVDQALCLSGSRISIADCIVQLKYVAVCMLSVTFLVVVFVLAPTLGGADAYITLLTYGSMLYHHTLCPILAFASFLLFESDGTLTRTDAVFALFPTIAYALITTLLNILHLLDGPYPFLHVYEQPFYMSVLWFILIPGGAFLIAMLIRQFSNRAALHTQSD